MTQYNKTTLKTFFETGDVPVGQNFSDFIDSCVNQQETSVQTMAGALNPTELITPRVSAGTVNVTGVLTISGSFSAPTIIADNIISSAHTTNVLTVTGDVSANSGVLFASAARFSTGIVSALGSTQATAAPLSFTINDGAGVVDGSTTGFIIPANQRGRTQYILNGGASANLWPCVGGQINALASNAAFGMTASTLYTIVHTKASGYAVK